MDSSLWTEKYRPKLLCDVVDQKHVVERLKSFVKEGKIPHMLFAGSPGTGKTTCALAIANELFGENTKYNFQETNASDQRGIDVIRNKIKNFSNTEPIQSPIKIIFLDEADALTSDAQNALRRLMEMYPATRFILSCNYSSNIITPLQSRSVVFRFKSLSKENVMEYLNRIVAEEKLKIDKEALESIYELSEGDMRKATNMLQSSASMGKKITKDVVYEVASKAEPKEVIEMLDLSLKGKFMDARNILRDLLLKKGVSGQDIIKEISNQVYKLDIADSDKVKLISRIGDFEFRINQGGNEQIQIEALLAKFSTFRK
jgi:replication factor C small subunit